MSEPPAATIPEEKAPATTSSWKDRKRQKRAEMHSYSCIKCGITWSGRGRYQWALEHALITGHRIKLPRREKRKKGGGLCHRLEQ
ncbi:hypothetical protein Ngar_c13560 [Candidatus Nitrososphaera gargensis Ga9.2]|uniref:Uncharacterized protein n=1 Tax=Nitrososphaera gargensis (strain Ga9.2) TaxID=1237085 RepID=K0IMV7_NITGG|nr:hypothetical protein [Candidatus Nitrososphaera gargensis]AFU58294.1 hypothetical protein Ngar_c13560 [Candidatus Nitrososphaera gargensis Ga9.2]